MRAVAAGGAEYSSPQSGALWTPGHRAKVALRGRVSTSSFLKR